MPSDKTLKASRPAGPADESSVDNVGSATDQERARTTDGVDPDAPRAEAENDTGARPADRSPIALGGRDRVDGPEADVDGVAADRTDVDGADVDRTDVDGADVDRTDVDGADVDRTDLDRDRVDRSADAAVEVLHDNRPNVPLDDEPVSPEPVSQQQPAVSRQREAPDEEALRDEEVPRDERPLSTEDAALAQERADGSAEPAPGDVPVPQAARLWPDADGEALRERWRELQSRFVDDPRGAAAEADDLIGEAVERLTAALTEQRQRLGSWRSGGEFDTEHLRVTVTGYRQFLDRVLSI
jgi:hypothetical protein